MCGASLLGLAPILSLKPYNMAAVSFTEKKSRFSDGALLSQGGPSAENRTKEA